MIPNTTASTDFTDFFSAVKTKIQLTKEVKNIYGKTLSPGFNAFDFWSINENKVSEILAFFLNPHASHHQGDIFLKKFIKRFELDFVYTKEDIIKVKCEDRTDSNRRIDIVISKNIRENVIGIENKIHSSTPDQENQVSDYLKHLSELSTSGKYCLLYLSPLDKKISSNSISEEDVIKYTGENKLKLINYQEDIINLVHSFSLSCESERVRYFLIEFEKKLKQMYTGEDSIEDNKFITEYILEKPENLAVTIKIAQNLIQVKQVLKQRFEQQLKEIGVELQIRTEGHNLYPSNWSNHHIAFSYELGGIIYGLKRNTPDKERSQLGIEKEFNNKFKVSESWPMYALFYSNIDFDATYWLDINSGEAKGKAKEFISKINSEFNVNLY